MSNPYDTQVGGDHYSKMKIQPSEFINKNEMLFAEGNAIKYICRHGSKGRLQDLLKAKHYIDMIIERDYSEEMKGSSVDSGVDTDTFITVSCSWLGVSPRSMCRKWAPMESSSVSVSTRTPSWLNRYQ